MKILYSEGSAEITEKKSRFIATLVPVDTEEAALEELGKIRKKHHQAKHNCYAYITGKENSIIRCSDDGEPAQTAGKPMLDVLLHEEVTRVLVVVTRYFGGILLGTGGLVRAYQKAVIEGLANCSVLSVCEGRRVILCIPYTYQGKIVYELSQKQIYIEETLYEDKVTYYLILKDRQRENMEQSISEITNSEADIIWKEEVDIGEINGSVVIFEKN